MKKKTHTYQTHYYCMTSTTDIPSIRFYLRVIRNLKTEPDDVLDNGMSVKDVATQYVMLYRTPHQKQIKETFTITPQIYKSRKRKRKHRTTAVTANTKKETLRALS